MFTLFLASAAIFIGLPGFGRAEAAYPGADNLTVASSQCNADGSISIAFVWTTYGLGAQELDVSTANNGFLPSTYGAATGLAATQTQYVWKGIYPGIYYARVLTQTSAGWVAAPTIQVTIGGCGLQGAYPADPYFPQPAPVLTPPTPTYPGPINGAPGYQASDFVYNVPVPSGALPTCVSTMNYMGYGGSNNPFLGNYGNGTFGSSGYGMLSNSGYGMFGNSGYGGFGNSGYGPGTIC